MILSLQCKPINHKLSKVKTKGIIIALLHSKPLEEVYHVKKGHTVWRCGVNSCRCEDCPV